MFSGNCRAKFSKSFRSFQTRPPDYAAFRLWGAQFAGLQSSAACRQHVRVASPKSRTCCPGVVLVNCQLSGVADTRQGRGLRAGDPILHSKFSRRRLAADLDEDVGRK